MKKVSYTSDCLVFAPDGNDLALLLVKRKNSPFKNMQAFPGGFIEQGEEPFEGAKRELLEETGLNLSNEKNIQLTVRQREGRDPRGNIVTYPFVFYLKSQKEVKAASDAADARWVKIKEIDSLAFDHGAILCEALGTFWASMPSAGHNYEANIQIPFYPSNYFNKSNEIVFFGGSFNPLHEGHLECIRQMGNKSVVIVPDSNPWKKQAFDGCFWKSINQIQRKLDRPLFPGFWGVESSNTTFSWFKDVSFSKKSLLIGDDNFLSFHKWFEFEKLLELVYRIYVVPRDFESNMIEDFKNNLLEGAFKSKIKVLQVHEYQGLSSTKIREGNID